MAKTITKKTIKKASTKLAAPAKKLVKTIVKKVSKKSVANAVTTGKRAAKTPKAAATAYKVAQGSSVPRIEATATSGSSFSTGSVGTQAVVLYFYPKDNTPGCTLEGQDFRKLFKKFEEVGAQIFGVSQDSLASHEKFKSKCDFPFELISDVSGEVCKAFDVVHMKSMYGREFLGIERSTFVIKNGVIAKDWRKVKVNGHAQEVLDFVKGL